MGYWPATPARRGSGFTAVHSHALSGRRRRRRRPHLRSVLYPLSVCRSPSSQRALFAVTTRRRASPWRVRGRYLSALSPSTQMRPQTPSLPPSLPGWRRGELSGRLHRGTPSRGFGFVTFEAAESAEAALREPSHTLRGHSLAVKLAESHDPGWVQPVCEEATEAAEPWRDLDGELLRRRAAIPCRLRAPRWPPRRHRAHQPDRLPLRAQPSASAEAMAITVA